MSKKRNPFSAKEALKEFVEAINATGGVFEDANGYYVPAADEDWLDLGEAYVKACRALGVSPKGV